MDWNKIAALFAELGDTLDIEDYDQETGRYLHPGKFEGETVLTVYAYAVIHSCGEKGLVFDKRDREAFGKLISEGMSSCKVYTDNYGFVYIFDITEKD